VLYDISDGVVVDELFTVGDHTADDDIEDGNCVSYTVFDGL